MLIRAITSSDLVSSLIRDREGPADPALLGFTPSHVEIALADGYLGAHDDGGVQLRPVGYDAAALIGEAFFDVPLPDEAAAEKFARGKIGTPYDFLAIAGFVVPLAHAHENGHAICSAFVRVVLEQGALFAGRPLAKPPWATAPLDLAFLLSALPGVTLRQTLPQPPK